MNSFSLLTTPWLPVRFKDGTTGKLAPVDLADENVVDIAAPRADLQGAAWQFLLGLCRISRRSREIKFRSLRYCLRFPALKQRSLIKTTLLSVA